MVTLFPVCFRLTTMGAITYINFVFFLFLYTDPTRFRLAHETSFVKRHTGLSTKPGIRWLVAFFRQFFGSISKIDYLTIRHGFINKHCGSSSQFDFHKYIKRSMEDDFKEVLGIRSHSPCLIFSFVIYIVSCHSCRLSF
ncbi:hypothetical protein HanXRQr2_Chr14g0620291 [Helianthus annuus]|uniref:Uncharacterized protein n=1 Tax=Helianthus annuus TaxID=4232 RepID=A0A9K3E6R5_HELAN|nr:hypothetical protein HanXRQr2_Chr14g0620291 [Helianthus annuus]